MHIKDIALFLRADAPSAAAIAMAADLAKREGAAVNGVCLCSEPELPLADSYAIGRAAVVDVLEQRDRAVETLVRPIEAAFRSRLEEAGVASRWQVVGPGEPAEVTALRARFSDLVVVPRAEHGQSAQMALTGNLVLGAGTPCLVVPQVAEPRARFERIVVGWDASPNAKRALDAAMGFLAAAVEVTVVTVDEAGTPRVEGEWSSALLEHLARHGVQASLRQESAHGRTAGDAIVDACARFAAQLLVMGAYAHGMGTEVVFGGATRTVLSKAPVPVLMAH